MPEGPEVETIRQDIEPLLKDQQIKRIWLNPIFFNSKSEQADLKKLVNQQITKVRRHGKLLWLETSENQNILVRLGMSGKLFVQPKTSQTEKHTHVRIELRNENEFRLVDPRRFGSLKAASSLEKQAVLNNIGPDPLSWNSKEKSSVLKKLQKSSRLVKNILLDQKVLSGVGNIYASEAIFLAKINPEARGLDLTKSKAEKLLDSAEKVLKKAVQYRGTSFMSYVDGWGEKGDNFANLYVFSKAGTPCQKCSTSIEKSTQSGRSTFFCPKCQK